MKKTKNMFFGLAVSVMMAMPLSSTAQQKQQVTIDPTSQPVSYAAKQVMPAADGDAKRNAPVTGMKLRRHRSGGTYTAAAQLKDAKTATLNNLLMRDQPLRISGDQVRRAAKAKGKAPFKPDNDHKYLIVNVIYNTLDVTQESGLFALDVQTGELTCLFSGFEDYDNYGFNGGAYVWNGKYRGVFYDDENTVSSSSPARVMDFNMSDWSFDEDAYIETTIPYQTSMAIECATEYHADGTTSVVGQFWGVDSQGNLSMRYATLDDNGRTTTRLGLSGMATKQMLAMGVTSDGRLYGVAKDGNLYQINRSSGAEVLIGHTGIDDLVDHEGFFWLQGGEIDPRDNTFYWVADHAAEEHSLLCTVDLATGRATVIIDFVGDVECAGVVIAPQQRQSATPAAATNLTATFGKLQTTGSGSFTAPTTSFDGKTLDAATPLYYNIYVNDVKQTVANNQTTPGATVNFSIAATNVKNHAENTIRVTTALTPDGEESLSAQVKTWVGYGIAQAPQQVAMTFDEATQTATISWQHPATGDNAGVSGGVVETVSYFVYRVVDGEKAATDIHNGYPLMDDQTSITYTLTQDDLTMSLADLSFAVVAVTSQWGFPLVALTSEPAMTGSMAIGRGKELPYWVDFANDYYDIRQKDFTIIDGNGDGKTWSWCEPHLLLGQQLCGAVATSNYTTTLESDEWFITPGIALEAGKSYHFKSNMHGPTMNMYSETIEICLGTAKTKAAMTQTIIEPTPVVEYCVIEGDFTVPADDNYYIGLHAVSMPGQWEIAAFDISVTDNAGTLEDRQSPAAGLLTVTPLYGVTEGTDGGGNTVYNGAATFGITLPTKQQDGNSLNGRLLNVTLTATTGTTTQTLHEWTDQTPGATLTYEAANLPSGDYTFGLYAAYTEGDFSYRSPAAVATAYVGWDNQPARPDNVQVVQSGDKLLVRFSPEAQPKGAHGGYLPSVSYRAYSFQKANQLQYYSQNGQTYVFDMIQPDAETDGTEMQIPDFNPSEGMQYNFSYTVLAVSKDAQGNNIYSDFRRINAVIGAPQEAPVFETGNQTFILDAAMSPDLEETWNYWLNRGTQAVGIQPIEDQFGFDAGKSWYAYSAFSGELTPLFGKVDIGSLANPMLNLDYILEDTDTDMEVVLNGPDGLQATHQLTVMDGMQHLSLPLADYRSWGWVQPALKCSFHLTVEGDHYHDIFFDNVGIYDAQPVNLAITGFEVPTMMNAGEEAMVNVSVMNLGKQAASGFFVTLSEDEVVTDTRMVNQSLQPGEMTVVQFRYRANTVTALDATGMADAEKVLTASVAFVGDAVFSDNMADAVITIEVKGGTQNSSPTAVVATTPQAGAAIDVTWQFDMDETAQQVTESFEDYELWYTGGVASGAKEGMIGPWHLYDNDNKPTYTWRGMEYLTEYAGEPQAFQVFDGTFFVGMSDYYYYNLYASTGNQYLVSMDPADGNYTPQPDDYLISPRVRGGSVVEFYYGALLRQPQGMEVLYSETGQDVSDFKQLKNFDDVSGTDWQLAVVTLPATAKYFAIHHCRGSYLGYGLKVDDITYSKITSVDHFNIYLDGKLVGQSTQTAYSITEPIEQGTHRVAVTAVFADGTESVPAYATVSLTQGIDQLVASGKPFDVYSADGKLLRRQTRSLDGLQGTVIIRTAEGSFKALR